MFHVGFAMMFSTPQTSTTTRRYRHEKTDGFDARPLARPRQRSCCFLAGHDFHQEDQQEEGAQEKEGRHHQELSFPCKTPDCFHRQSGANPSPVVPFPLPPAFRMFPFLLPHRNQCACTLSLPAN